MRISCRGLGASGLGRKLPTHGPLVGAGRFGHVRRCNPGGPAPLAIRATASEGAVSPENTIERSLKSKR